MDFAQDEADLGADEQLCAALQREMLSLRPWYDMAVEKQGRTTVGTSGIAVDELGSFVCSFLSSVEPENPSTGVPLGYTLKLAAEDLKAYYLESMTAQPGQESAPSKVLTDWFWEETVAGGAGRREGHMREEREPFAEDRRPCPDSPFGGIAGPAKQAIGQNTTPIRDLVPRRSRHAAHHRHGCEPSETSRKAMVGKTPISDSEKG